MRSNAYHEVNIGPNGTEVIWGVYPIGGNKWRTIYRLAGLGRVLHTRGQRLCGVAAGVLRIHKDGQTTRRLLGGCQ